MPVVNPVRPPCDRDADPAPDHAPAFVRVADAKGPGAVAVFALGTFGPDRSPRACILDVEEVRRDEHGHYLGRFFRLWHGGVFEVHNTKGGVWYCTPRGGVAYPLAKREVEARLRAGAAELPPLA